MTYVAERSRGYDAARRALSPTAAVLSSRGAFFGTMNAAVSLITVSLDILASFGLQRGLSLATMFTVCAVATAVSVVLFCILPSRGQLDAAHPLPRAATLTQQPSNDKPPSAGPGAVLRLMADSRELQLLLVVAVCSGTQGSYSAGSLNADVVAPSLGVSWVGCKAPTPPPSPQHVALRSFTLGV